ncbi:hypothetical protein [Desulforamulus aeronauticus]|uniref:Uncharacterized protein n=1 Tax=Desulforamulus aeronauticus DSM 10349 TaxID=1121421 RepID=A0A1M6SUL2_9FIRM|nr:hypothetical protein [Desulforamulus aeronauticus]SHK48393.1 hypothetical protein SAMN02745123_02035 [Desulforamulus aeronauticus DSM 10349]
MKLTKTRIRTLVMVFGMLTLAACSNSTAPSGQTTPLPSTTGVVEQAQSGASVPDNLVQPIPEDLIKDFADSVEFDNEKGILSFTVPKGLPPEYSFSIWVGGRIKMGDGGGMSVHPFGAESENNSWEAGKTYSYEFEEDSFLEASIVFDVQINRTPEILHEIAIGVDENGNISISKIFSIRK